MQFDIEINGKSVTVKKDETIMNVLDRIGIKLPTLCSMKEYTPTGACRMCVIEAEGRENLIPSCSYKVEEWMKIHTHSAKVIKARKTLVELLLADHPDDCLYCERNGNCELQRLAEDLHVRERRITGPKSRFTVDKSNSAMVYNPAKCILCNRCVRVCAEKIGVHTFDRAFRGKNMSIQTAMNKPLNHSNCILCGQCTMVCPTGALTERITFSELDTFLHDPDKKVVALYSPSISVTLAEAFGIKNTRDIEGIINAVLHKVGFNRVFDTAFSADVVVMEEAAELMERIKNNGPFPMFTSCCPSWVKYVEQYRPELIPHLARVKSPQQIMGALIKSFYAESEKIQPENIYTVAIMPCTSKKFEAMRPEMTNKGITDVDAVITTRELVRLIRMNGIDVNTLDPEPPDQFLTGRSSSGKMVGVSGGTAEAAIRTFYNQITGQELEELSLADLRGSHGMKTLTLEMGDMNFQAGVVNGMVNITPLLEDIDKGMSKLHFIEVMACQGGCIAGGGQPLRQSEETLKKRIKNVYDIDVKETIRVSHKNPQIIKIYKDYLKAPNNPLHYELLHTRYAVRKVLL